MGVITPSASERISRTYFYKYIKYKQKYIKLKDSIYKN